MAALQEWLGNYRLKWETAKKGEDDAHSLMNTALKILETKIATFEKQLNNTYDFHEQGVYTAEEFLTRSRSIAERVANAKKEYAEIKSKINIEIIREENRQTIIPKVEHLLNVYNCLPTPAAKNHLIKEVLEKVVYTKIVNGSFRGVSADDFEIILYPKLPKYKEAT